MSPADILLAESHRRPDPGKLAEAQKQSILICRKLGRHGRRPAWLNGELLAKSEAKDKNTDWKQGWTTLEE